MEISVVEDGDKEEEGGKRKRDKRNFVGECSALGLVPGELEEVKGQLLESQMKNCVEPALTSRLGHAGPSVDTIPGYE